MHLNAKVSIGLLNLARILYYLKWISKKSPWGFICPDKVGFEQKAGVASAARGIRCDDGSRRANGIHHFVREVAIQTYTVLY